jgi:membrane protein YdbS with pleckstrin-like domain
VHELFAPQGVRWRPVSPQLARMRRTVLLVWVAVAVAAAVLVHLVVSFAWWVTAVAVLALLAALAAGWFLIGRNARAWGFAERDEDLYVRHGALFRELIVVPYGRMQYVDVTSGPVERRYGVATVSLHTASPKTSAHIPGLPAAEAARLRDRLTELGEAQAAGL